jgi:competence protein ComEA
MKTFTAVPRSLTLGMLLAASALLCGPASAATAAATTTRVNINTADAATIDAGLLYVGRAKAEAIVAYRKQHGAFHSAEQLAQVKGIGLKTIEKNRDRIVLAGGGGAPAVQRPPRPAARRPAKK